MDPDPTLTLVGRVEEPEPYSFGVSGTNRSLNTVLDTRNETNNFKKIN
jgi:hypothetical protein